MLAESKPDDKHDFDPAAGKPPQPTDKQAAYAYPYPGPSYPSYSYGAPPPPQAGCPVVAAPPYYPYGGSAAPAPAPPPPDHHQGARCLSRFLSCVLIFLLFFLIASLLLRLMLNPYIPEVSVSTVFITDFDLSETSHLLSANFEVVLAISNPRSDASIHYDHVAVGVLYDDEVISYTPIPSFRQDQGNTTTIEARMAAVGEHLKEDTVEGIYSERNEGSGGGDVTFRIRMFAWVRFVSVDEDWWSSRYEMNAYCDRVLIGFAGAPAKAMGALDRTRVSCTVTI